jgi:hypothetical protein
MLQFKMFGFVLKMIGGGEAGELVGKEMRW